MFEYRGIFSFSFRSFHQHSVVNNRFVFKLCLLLVFASTRIVIVYESLLGFVCRIFSYWSFSVVIVTPFNSHLCLSVLNFFQFLSWYFSSYHLPSVPVFLQFLSSFSSYHFPSAVFFLQFFSSSFSSHLPSVLSILF